MKRLLIAIFAVLFILLISHAGAEGVLTGEDAVYTLFDCPKDHLEHSEAYGRIYPYTGCLPCGDRDSKTAGFFNGEGQLITDPIYSDIIPVRFGKDGKNFFWEVTDPSEMHGIVSKDGSYVSEISAIGEHISRRFKPLMLPLSSDC